MTLDLSSARTVRRVVSRFEPVAVSEEEAQAYGQPASAPHLIAKLLAFLADSSTEQFWCVLLDSQNKVIGTAQVSVGTLSSSLVHPREVFGPAVRIGAASIIVAHNHPSGDPEPSGEDLRVTRRLIDAGKLLGIPVLDHVVIAHTGHVSLRTRMDFGGAA